MILSGNEREEKSVGPAEQRIPSFFISLSLVFLSLGLIFGLIASLQYLFPSLLRLEFPFSRWRPLHVSMVISWIFTAASGGLYYYIQDYTGRSIHSVRLGWIHGILLSVVSLITIILYSTGKFGGREYLEFPAWLGIPLILYWLIFMYNIFRSMKRKSGTVPVYIWMWSTGLIFFLITFLESQLWLIGFFGENLIREVTVQWKALGSMVGSWNMLVYGTAFYVMEKISGDEKQARSPLTFFFYFLGLTNLMFNWGHHTYIVPASPWIRNVAYIISMTELLILANIIWQWNVSVRSAKKNFHIISYKFFIASDVWIFLNLIQAIAMSVPAINLYTHGTHVTVAHAMGTTIGINCMILFASLFYMSGNDLVKRNKDLTQVTRGFWLVNISLFFFWLSLITAGIKKALLVGEVSHALLMKELYPFFALITVAGIVMITGFFLILTPLLKINIGKILKY